MSKYLPPVTEGRDRNESLSGFLALARALCFFGSLPLSFYEDVRLGTRGAVLMNADRHSQYWNG